jgi:peptide/nickel transport system permease protein
VEGDYVLPRPSARIRIRRGLGGALGALRFRSGTRRRWNVRQHPVGVLSVIILVLIVLSAALAPLLAPYNPNTQDLAATLQPPVFDGGSWHHVLGTDALGRDMLTRIMYGGRVSLMVGVVAVLISGVIGVALGATSGYVGGVLDAAVMRLADLQLSIPFLVLALAVMAALGTSLTNLVAVLVVSGWVSYARVTRGVVLSIREREFVLAAHTIGTHGARMLFRHILPFVVAPILVVATLQVGLMILTEASLSFLGLGVPPDVPSWGSIIADGQDYLTTSWWIMTLPGIAIFLAVLSVNFLGDWVRDVLDPTLQV